jgi:hypothetical protein
MRPVLFCILMSFLSCNKKPAPKPNILSLREMSDLATVEYTVTKVIKASDNKTWFKVGERRILMSCEAQIKAGIDMSSINKNSFKINEKNIEVTLPAPKIISFSIPTERIKTEYEETGVFRDKFTAQDRNALAIQAEKQIRKSIDSLGILQQAKVNTAQFVTNFLKRLSYENISIKYNQDRSLKKLE